MLIDAVLAAPVGELIPYTTLYPLLRTTPEKFNYIAKHARARLKRDFGMTIVAQPGIGVRRFPVGQEQAPTQMFLCRVCGTTDPNDFYLRMRNGKPSAATARMCKKDLQAQMRAKHAENKQAAADRLLLRKYGVSREAYDSQLQAQGGTCPGCGRTREEDIENRGRRWPVDHDHGTDDVRGILCWLCNLALGAVRDEPDTLRRLADYVEQGGVWDAP